MKIWIVTNKNVKQFRVTNIAHFVSEYLYKDRLQKNENCGMIRPKVISKKEYI